MEVHRLYGLINDEHFVTVEVRHNFSRLEKRNKSDTSPGGKKAMDVHRKGVSKQATSPHWESIY